MCPDPVSFVLFSNPGKSLTGPWGSASACLYGVAEVCGIKVYFTQSPALLTGTQLNLPG